MTIAKQMYAMVLEQPGTLLVNKQVDIPKVNTGQVLIRIIACGVCRTDLHIVDDELKEPKLPLIPGHEVIGTIALLGQGVSNLKVGTYVGVPWLGYTCGRCKFCKSGLENLCDTAKFTGYTLDGGFAEFMVANANYCVELLTNYHFPWAAPLLCAGLIGYRSYNMISPAAKRIGLYGFGAAAHILTQIAVAQQKAVFAFTKPDDREGQKFARKMGATWAGGSDTSAPEKLDAAILFAPSGDLVPKALADLDKSGQVICGGIHMSDIPAFPYNLLWEERSIQSVANLTRSDGKSFFSQIQKTPVKTEVMYYQLDEANEALTDLREGRITGAAVLLT